MVRDAVPSDLPDIARIENHWIQESFAHFGEDPLSIQEVEAAYAAAQGRFPWVVKDQDGVVGFARASAWKLRAGYRWTAEIGVYIDPAYQGRGFGKELYAALFPRLQASGFRHIVAGIALPNEASVRLHEAFGMSRAATFPDMGFKQGAWRSVGYWSLLMGSGNPDAK